LRTLYSSRPIRSRGAVECGALGETPSALEPSAALANSSTYTNLVYLATSLILLPYLWSAAYQVLLAIRGETYETGHGRARDLIIGVVALGYAVWLVYAGGWQYLLVAAMFYLVGTAGYLWARRESRLPAFTRPELVIGAVVAVTSVVAAVLMATGNLSVL